MVLGAGGDGGRDRHLGTAEGLVSQDQLLAVVVFVVVVVAWVAGCAAAV